MKLTLDIGGSKTRGFLYTDNATAENTASIAIELKGGYGKAEDSEQIEPDLFAALNNSLEDNAPKITAIAVNLGGKNKNQITRTVSALCPRAHVVVHRESEGVLARRILRMHKANILIMAGTGCIAFSQSAQGERVLGGWGKEYGDEGSGYSLGMKAVRCALKELDSGANETSLLTQTLFGWQNAFSFHNITEYAAARDDVRGKIPKSREGVAALTKTVVDCAEQGCTLSQRILNETGEDLAEIALRAIKASALAQPVVVINGGITKVYPLWRDAFFTRIKKEEKEVKVVCFNDGIDRALKEIVEEI